MEKITEEEAIKNADYSLQFFKENNTDDTIELEEMKITSNRWNDNKMNSQRLESHQLGNCNAKIKIEFESLAMKTEQDMNITENLLTHMEEIINIDNATGLQEMKIKCESKTNGQILESYPLEFCNKSIKKELEYGCLPLNTEQGLDISKNHNNYALEVEDIKKLHSADEGIKKELEFESVFMKTEEGLNIDKNYMDEITEEKLDKNANPSWRTFKMNNSDVTVKLEEMNVELDKWDESGTLNGGFDFKENISHMGYGDMENISFIKEEGSSNEVLTVTQPGEILRACTIIHERPDHNKTLNFEQLFGHTTAFQEGDRNVHRTNMLCYEGTSNVECDVHVQNSNSYMPIHKEVSAIKILKCEICAYITNNKYTLKCHMITHKKTSEVKMYLCELCNYQAKWKSSLKKHMLIHKDLSDIKMFKCEICSYQGKQKSHLTRHMLIHKKLSESKMFKCGICTFETKLKNSLKRHVLTHQEVSVIKMFQCEICTYKAKRMDALQIHMLIHKKPSETKMYQCEICTYEARRKRYLKTHMLIHKKPSEIEMFKCEICTYETKQKSSVKIHMLVHKKPSEIKMFKCEMCTYEVKYKNCLKNHMLIHK